MAITATDMRFKSKDGEGEEEKKNKPVNVWINDGDERNKSDMLLPSRSTGLKIEVESEHQPLVVDGRES